VTQPYEYRRREVFEPDWRRLPGWRDVTEADWASARWQRSNCVKSVRELRELYGGLLDDLFYRDLARDQRDHATMPLLLTPQMLNTMVPEAVPTTDAMYADPVRRYMLPLASDRDLEWPSHPMAARDPLHETEMWTVEGLIHRYPTKVLVELLPTCPQYCGHCTRMDLVGKSTAQVEKQRFREAPGSRYDRMIEYLRRTPAVRDVVASGGDLANLPITRLEAFVDRLLEIDSIRDVRLASKAIAGLPQHWLQDDVRAGIERLARKASERGVQLAIHTHVNAAQSVTPSVAGAARAMLDAGIRAIRNQAVLLRGVNDSTAAVLDLSFALLDETGVTPYYVYMCDMVPNSEHWRVSLAEAVELQHAIMGYLPGFATPRIVCDVPYCGKQWVDQAVAYDRTRGVSHWRKHYRTLLEVDDADALERTHAYYDPIATLPPEGRSYWRKLTDSGALDEGGDAEAGALTGAARVG
jgi:lysine 2,3-aminomutase